MPQISATIKPQTIDAIKVLAEQSNRTFSQMTDILLERAVKEANRKKKKDTNS